MCPSKSSIYGHSRTFTSERPCDQSHVIVMTSQKTTKNVQVCESLFQFHTLSNLVVKFLIFTYLRWLISNIQEILGHDCAHLFQIKWNLVYKARNILRNFFLFFKTVLSNSFLIISSRSKSTCVAFKLSILFIYIFLTRFIVIINIITLVRHLWSQLWLAMNLQLWGMSLESS